MSGRQFEQSRSTWYPAVLSSLLVPHGEKFQMLDGANQDLLKHNSTEVDLLNPTYPELCGVSPLIGQHLPTNAFSITQINNCQDFNDIIMKPLRISSNQDAQKLKLEMEEFRDLTAYLPNSPKAALNSVDELNTPIFEREGPFDFTQQFTQYTDQQSNNNAHSSGDPFMFKIKTEQSDVNTSNLSAEFAQQQQTLDVYKTEECVTNSYLDNKQSAIINDSILFSPCNSENGENLCNNSLKPTPTYADKMDAYEYFTNVDDFKDFLLAQGTINSTPGDNVCKYSPSAKNQDVAYDTPENSNSGSELDYRYPRLQLNVTGKVYEGSSSLSTPDIIRTITDIENDNFNILDIVSEKEIETVSTEDLHLNVTPSSIPPPPPTRTRPTIGKSPRKRRRADSDEDYVPPARVGRKTIKITQPPPDYDTDCSSDEEQPAARRGRPPKRHTSISSDGSKDSDANRYRELRDKNNEASRRSRLKRKMKEINLEKEADELEDKNLKLKTQVAELEKTVNNFRNNLFKIMLNK